MLGEAVLLLAGEQWLLILGGSQAATKSLSVKKVRVTVHSYTTSSLSNRLSVDIAIPPPNVWWLSGPSWAGTIYMASLLKLMPGAKDVAQL